MHLFYVLCLLFLPQTGAPAQSQSLSEDQLVAINSYVDYFNESIHGMLIIHRLLENNNQDINKYVDLEGFKINFYSNNDLPKNIFDDPEQWFYEVSPEKRFAELRRAEANLPSSLKSTLTSQANTIHQICKEVNQIRFDVEKYIDGHDLEDKDQLYGVYELLDKAVRLYNSFYETQLEFEASITPFYTEELNKLSSDSFHKMYYVFSDMHRSAKNMLHALRLRDDTQFDMLLGKMEKSYAAFQDQINDPTSNSSMKSGLQYTTIDTKVKEIIKAAKMIDQANVPEEYKLYGKFYYFHNSNLINKFNRYGNGFVNEMNTILKSQSATYPRLIEVPHYYQVIYPMKIIEEDYIISENEQITAIPIELENRKINKSTNVIKAETNLLEIELYDYKLKDNDIVSINFNGDWVYRNLSLETEPKKLKLKLNDTGVNYLIIYAESVGVISPNTTAIKYRIGPKRDEIILESDLNSSALIEFSLDE